MIMTLGDGFSRRKQIESELETWMNRLRLAGRNTTKYQTKEIEGENKFTPIPGTKNEYLRHYTIEECNEKIKELIEEDRKLAMRISITNQQAKAEMKDLDAKAGEEFGLLGNKVFRRLENLNKPVIAAVSGFALGGGCELAMSCDIRIASEKAKFGQPEAGLGITPGFGGTQRLPRLVGAGKAKELIYTCAMVKADEALRIGLVNKVFDSVEELREGAMKLASTLTTKPGVAVKLAKKSLNLAWEISEDKNLEFEVDVFCETFDTEDKDEGVDAFLNKREPTFKHK